jgi:L-lactate dehydrogenase complex protein LldG
MTLDNAHSDARSAIFASIRDNLAASASFDAIRNEHHVHAASELALTGSTIRDRAEVINGFRENLKLLGAKCAFVENEPEAADRLSEIVNVLNAKKIVISDSELVHRIVNASGFDAVQDASREELFASDIGVTSAQWAIAETGTLVLGSGAERHRLVSLVPPVHVCILLTGSIRQSMAEILEIADPDANRTITFITGASRTSDIELTLAIGVHGPGELHVIVIKDQ